MMRLISTVRMLIMLVFAHSLTTLLFPQTAEQIKRFEENLRLRSEIDNNFQEDQIVKDISRIFKERVDSCQLGEQSSGSKNVMYYYIVKNQIREKNFKLVEKSLKKQLNLDHRFSDYSDRVQINNSITEIIEESAEKNYFSEQLVISSVNNKNYQLSQKSELFIIVLMDNKNRDTNGEHYIIAMSLINARTSKTECNISKKIKIIRENGEVVDYKLNKINFDFEEVLPEEPFRPDDNILSINLFISGNLYTVTHYVPSSTFKDKYLLFYGASIEYDRRIINDFYMGIDLAGGAVYFSSGVFYNESSGFFNHLVIDPSIKFFIRLPINEMNNAFVNLGGKVGFFYTDMTSDATYGFDGGVVVSLHLGYFNLEAAYPFPWLTMGFVTSF